MSDQDRLLSDEVVDSPTMTDKQFVDVLRAKLWRIHSKDIDNAEIAIENALEHIWSTMTRNARVEQQKRLYAESVLNKVLALIDKNIEASESNLKYAREHNNSDTTIANWKGCIEGEKFIKDDVIRILAEQRSRINDTQ